MQSSQICRRHTVCTTDLNGYDFMHGGRLLTLCDEICYISASQHGNCDCLTRAVHRARFHQPAKLGEQLSFSAIVGLTGHSSIWVTAEVRSCRNHELVMDAVFVFTAVNKAWQKIEVPRIKAVSAVEKRIQAEMKSMRSQLT